MKCFILSVSWLLSLPLFAIYTHKDGRFMHVEEVATHTAQEHYSAMLEAHQNGAWKELVRQGNIIAKNFLHSPFAQEAEYYLGVGFFHLEEYDLANKHLGYYLKKEVTGQNLEGAIQSKFLIAEAYKEGAKKHLMGLQAMPKWLGGEEDALIIYDEVIAALPNHELAARSLFSKAQLLHKSLDFDESIQTYQTLIRRFPKHTLAPESYLGIAQAYLSQCQAEYPNPDFLELAQINLRKFRLDFPGEERASQAEQMLLAMKEIYASNLYEIAQFYERTKKFQAARLYYTRVISKYPDTKLAAQAGEHLQALADPPVAAQ